MAIEIRELTEFIVFPNVQQFLPRMDLHSNEGIDEIQNVWRGLSPRFDDILGGRSQYLSVNLQCGEEIAIQEEHCEISKINVLETRFRRTMAHLTYLQANSLIGISISANGISHAAGPKVASQ